MESYAHVVERREKKKEQTFGARGKERKCGVGEGMHAGVTCVCTAVCVSAALLPCCTTSVDAPPQGERDE